MRKVRIIYIYNSSVQADIITMSNQVGEWKFVFEIFNKYNWTPSNFICSYWYDFFRCIFLYNLNFTLMKINCFINYLINYSFSSIPFNDH